MMKLQSLQLPVTSPSDVFMPTAPGQESEIDSVQISSGRKSRIFFLIGTLLLFCFLAVWVTQFLHHQIWPLNIGDSPKVIVLLFVAYVICMILPYLPAIELGLILLAILDIQGVLLLYPTTVLALLISHLIGRLIPVSVLKRLLRFFRFERASELLCAHGECDETRQVSLLIEHAPKRFIPYLLNHRYCVFAVAINTPGNMIIGGAGGIAMMSGMSRVFGTGKFLVTTMIAVLPLPIGTVLLKILLA